MEIILGILAYLMVGCTVSTTFYMLLGDYDSAIYFGLIWPIAVPLIIGITIITMLASIIAGLFTKNKKY